MGVAVKQDAGKMTMMEWLRFPQVSIATLLSNAGIDAADELLNELEQDGRYAPYLDRLEHEIRDVAANEQIRLSPLTRYADIAGLSNEMVERLDSAQPESLAAASRIRGITPAALAAILVHAKRSNTASVNVQ